jgi:NAD(P)-dependent dehydrogenase (short-subunit alcohol dehydrogenase family)
LDGKVAVITGGATGLGRAIADVYAEEGARLVIGDFREDEGSGAAAEIRAAGGSAVFVRADVRSSADVAGLVAAAEREYGRLDIMTANAGILGRCAGLSLVDAAEEDIDQVIEVNFKGVYLAFKHAVPAIMRSGGGAMTATASLAARLGYAKLDAYCASKGAITALVRSLSADLSPAIRVNAVSPGSMSTELGKHTMELKGLTEPAEVTVSRPLKPVATPRQVACAHLFLVSAEASFITGQDLVADGGWSVIPA